jgi:uncharacterized protein YyaL (SSP411 family)
MNAHFSAQRGGYNLTSTPRRPESKDEPLQDGGKEAQHDEPIMDMIMDMKPGSDTALPSPNGITASNLLLLSSYLQQSSYKTNAKQTIDAFGVEILQHPFLFVTMLSAIILEAVGIQGVVAVGEEAEVRNLAGFGRTLIKLQGNRAPSWLIEKNEFLRNLELPEGVNARIFICDAGGCREMKIGDLDAQAGQA